jgi:hypothetical protein
MSSELRAGATSAAAAGHPDAPRRQARLAPRAAAWPRSFAALRAVRPGRKVVGLASLRGQGFAGNSLRKAAGSSMTSCHEGAAVRVEASKFVSQGGAADRQARKLYRLCVFKPACSLCQHPGRALQVRSPVLSKNEPEWFCCNPVRMQIKTQLWLGASRTRHAWPRARHDSEAHTVRHLDAPAENHRGETSA